MLNQHAYLCSAYGEVIGIHLKQCHKGVHYRCASVAFKEARRSAKEAMKHLNGKSRGNHVTLVVSRSKPLKAESVRRGGGGGGGCVPGEHFRYSPFLQ